jgi:3D-(3,5/4)-trihydroxycyclohexane-1,2-dione acylhydrolase (decyclizing)
VKHGALALVGDAQSVLEDLGAGLSGWTAPAAYRHEIAESKSTWELMRAELVAVRSDTASPLLQSEVIGIVNEYAAAGATIVHAAGGLPGDLHKLWVCHETDGYHSEYGYSCMGYEIAGALGVRMAAPERRVYALLGDGSYLMLHTEIVTAVQEKLPVTIVLLDNGGYQCIHGLQRACGGKSFGNEFRQRDNGRLDGDRVAIDFAANARSLGAAAWRATNAAELRDALEAARHEAGPSLIHVPVEPRPLPSTAWWDVPSAEVSASPAVREARGRYEQARSTQRFHY